MAVLPTFETATFDATGLSGTYQDLGSALTTPAYQVTLHNTSNVDCYVSFDDGTSTNANIPAGQQLTIGALPQPYRSDNASMALPAGAQLQVKQVTGAGSSGDIIANIARM